MGGVTTTAQARRRPSGSFVALARFPKLFVKDSLTWRVDDETAAFTLSFITRANIILNIANSRCENVETNLRSVGHGTQCDGLPRGGGTRWLRSGDRRVATSCEKQGKYCRGGWSKEEQGPPRSRREGTSPNRTDEKSLGLSRFLAWERRAVGRQDRMGKCRA